MLEQASDCTIKQSMKVRSKPASEQAQSTLSCSMEALPWEAPPPPAHCQTLVSDGEQSDCQTSISRRCSIVYPNAQHFSSMPCKCNSSGKSSLYPRKPPLLGQASLGQALETARPAPTCCHKPPSWSRDSGLRRTSTAGRRSWGLGTWQCTQRSSGRSGLDLGKTRARDSVTP